MKPELQEAINSNETLRNIFANPFTTEKEKNRSARVALEKDINEQIESLKRVTTQRDLIQKEIDVLSAYHDWALKEPVVLQKNDCSRLHKLASDAEAGKVVLSDPAGKPKLGSVFCSDVFPKFKAFVIQNDWAAAFANATDYADGAFKLPYENCAFEFRINEHVVIILAMQQESDIEYMCFVECEGLWATSLGYNSHREHWLGFAKLAVETIRAACIALDAEVATHSVVRAPAKLNAKRVESGKLPLFDYRVISLARRDRVEPLTFEHGTHKSPRLHFRRGHWRHYENFKTWIKWTRVGNPDLGFIDKHYTL